MPTRKSGTVSAILTIVLLILLAAFLLLLEIVALNGVSQRQGLTAMGISLACQAGIMILTGLSARWMTNFLITKADWNQIMAVITAVLVAASVGGAISFLSMIIAIPVAGIR